MTAVLLSRISVYQQKVNVIGKHQQILLLPCVSVVAAVRTVTILIIHKVHKDDEGDNGARLLDQELMRPYQIKMVV